MTGFQKCHKYLNQQEQGTWEDLCVDTDRMKVMNLRKCFEVSIPCKYKMYRVRGVFQRDANNGMICSLAASSC